MNKAELQKQLEKLGIEVVAGNVRKSDVKKILTASFQHDFEVMFEKALMFDGDNTRSIMDNGKKLWWSVDTAGNEWIVQLEDDDGNVEHTFEITIKKA